MSLYHKYRPSSLNKIKGNEDIVEALNNMLTKKETFPHSILLHGETGCGKTTIARIIAKELNCTESDYIELNTSDFRGIDTAREIIKSSQFKPLNSDCRIWVIDECQKITNDAQNALLKILEDTPKHVYFILCTTDPQKLIAPIKNRCQQFQVTPLTEIQLFGLLRRIVKNENEELEKEVYDQIILDSMGHPRDAIQILEKVLSVTPENRLNIAKKSAEIQNQSIELCRVLMKKSNWGTVNKILLGLKGQEAEDIRRVILGYAQAVLLKADDSRAALIIEEFWEPFYNIGFPGLVYACYSVTKN
jgi:DNA polymerase-3 subunit gamma/tau